MIPPILTSKVRRRRPLDHPDVHEACRFLHAWMAVHHPDDETRRQAIDDIHTPRDLYAWLDDAKAAGIDPFVAPPLRDEG